MIGERKLANLFRLLFLFLFFFYGQPTMFSKETSSKPPSSLSKGEYFLRYITNKSANCSKKKVKNKKLLITGCARSGTAYISEFLQNCGLDVPHEVSGEFGCVSWMMAADDCMAPWGEGSLGYEFELVFHQVRNPLKCIASLFANEPLVGEYIFKHVPEINPSESKLTRAAKYWYYWNLLAEKKADWTYRIEDLEQVIGEMSSKLDVDLDIEKMKLISKETNHRKESPNLTWQDLKEELDDDLYFKI